MIEKVTTSTNKEIAKNDQLKMITKLFEENKSKLRTTEEWLESLYDYRTPDKDFEKIGNPLCDALILPKCLHLFDK